MPWGAQVSRPGPHVRMGGGALRRDAVQTDDQRLVDRCALPPKPSGKTVSSPPFSSVVFVTGLPSGRRDGCRFFQSCGTSRSFRASARATAAAGTRGRRHDRRHRARGCRPGSPRRRKTILPRSVDRRRHRLLLFGVESCEWRSSSKGPWGSRYLPHAENPKPKKNSPAPRRTPPIAAGRRPRRRRRSPQKPREPDEQDQADQTPRPAAGSWRRAAGGDRRAMRSRLGARGLAPVRRPVRTAEVTLGIMVAHVAPIAEPVGHEHQPADADQKGDEAFCDRPDPAEPEAAVVVRVLDRPGHVGDDVGHLLRRSAFPGRTAACSRARSASPRPPGLRWRCAATGRRSCRRWRHRSQ